MSGTATASTARAAGLAAARLRGGYAASALAAVAVLGAVVTLVFVVSLPLESDAESLADRVATAAFVTGMGGLGCVGAVLARRRAYPVMAWLMVLVGLTGVLARANVGYAVAAAEWAWPGQLTAGWLSNWSWVPAQAIAMTLLLRFPDGSLPRPGWRYVERAVWTWAAVSLVATALYPGPLGVEAPFALATDTGVVLEGLAYLALPAAIAVAVLRYRLWDLGLVIRRSVVFVVASALLAALYLGLVSAVDVVVGGRGWAAAVSGALLVAAVAVPVHHAAQRVLDRVLFGNRRDPYAVVRDIGSRLEAAGPDLLSAVVHELARSLRLPYVAVELPGGAPVAVAGTPTVEGLRLPLVRAGDVLGHLVVGRRRPDEPLTQLDVRLFEDIAGHASVAVQTVLLGEELRRSYERLQTVRETERSRLRRELHDGLGPVLGAVTMRAEAARNMVRSGAETENAVNEVRRFLDELRPTVLVDRGLVAALREFVDQYVRGIDVRLELPDDLPELGPAYEVAVYRVASEALRNAARHSGGASCTVRLSVSDGDVVLEVSDDGRGAGDSRPGVGLNAMRERVSELGGSLDLRPSPTGGLTVLARMPRGAQ
jgi:two-component system NarL family sensor kinase